MSQATLLEEKIKICPSYQTTEPQTRVKGVTIPIVINLTFPRTITPVLNIIGVVRRIREELPPIGPVTETGTTVTGFGDNHPQSETTNSVTRNYRCLPNFQAPGSLNVLGSAELPIKLEDMPPPQTAPEVLTSDRSLIIPSFSPIRHSGARWARVLSRRNAHKATETGGAECLAAGGE
ncbi:hypothetical protein BKA67DRAFT_540765 [Truncatella angustata]|uniref:Uncharacterized protein n=1 Tax=Truncatella angustata TaxID=152316 RepID=A0A9P8RMC4_9PEZI|nr:uncharacterized protein BKA67DRAFT_540765 [Truncatella angustata]KAH6645761.1 hypothetical protein BKA67DRAFT_540765 [Truncatella angustata]